MLTVMNREPFQIKTSQTFMYFSLFLINGDIFIDFTISCKIPSSELDFSSETFSSVFYLVFSSIFYRTPKSLKSVLFIARTDFRPMLLCFTVS